MAELDDLREVNTWDDDEESFQICNACGFVTMYIGYDVFCDECDECDWSEVSEKGNPI
jgi:hypothetical protein|tara:strand:+ start:57 stop:230 length:174 start_codon:yes stop_codon:yes gene_type:complete